MSTSMQEADRFFSRIISKKDILEFKHLCDKYDFRICTSVEYSKTKVRIFVMATGRFMDIDLDSIWSARKNQSGYELGAPISIKDTGEKGSIAHICRSYDRFYFTVKTYDDQVISHLESSDIKRIPALAIEGD